MRGHLVKRAKNSYSIVVELGTDPITRKRTQQWVSIKGSKKAAEKKLAELLHELDTGSFVKPGKTTLAEFLGQWLKDYAWSNLAPRTAEGYEHIIRRHIIPALGNIALTQLKPEHLQRYYSDKLTDLSSQSVRHHHMVLHNALKTAVRWGSLSRNPADAVSPPRTVRLEMQTWGEDDIHRFLEAAKDSQYYALFYLALFTGMRRSELLALRWQDVDLMLGHVYVNRGLHHLRDGSIVFRAPKTAKGKRSVALPPSAIMALKEHQERQKFERMMLGMEPTDEALVFSHPNGNPWLPNTVTHAWIKLVRRTGLKRIRLHDARHSHASLLLKQGTHPKIVQERLGHSGIAITLDTYSHVAPGLQQAAALRFDELFNHHTANEHNEIIR